MRFNPKKQSLAKHSCFGEPAPAGSLVPPYGVMGVTDLTAVKKVLVDGRFGISGRRGIAGSRAKRGRIGGEVTTCPITGSKKP